MSGCEFSAVLESPTLMQTTESDDVRGRLVRSASTITPLTLLSRVTGYLREKVIAFTLGAGMRTDAFFVAFRIPNMLREIIGEKDVRKVYSILREKDSNLQPAC